MPSLTYLAKVEMWDAKKLAMTNYGAAQRTKRVRKTLGKSQSVTDAIYDAGFN